MALDLERFNDYRGANLRTDSAVIFDVDEFDRRMAAERAQALPKLMEPTENGITHLTLDGVTPITQSPDLELSSDVDEEQIDENYTGPVEWVNQYGLRLVALPDIPPPSRETAPAEASEVAEIPSTKSVSPRRISYNGLKRLAASARSLPSGLSLRAAANIKSLNQAAVEKIKTFEARPKNKITAAALGGIALAAAAAGAYYLESKGLGVSHTGHTHGALEQIAPVKTHQPVVETMQHHEAAVTAIHTPKAIPVNHNIAAAKTAASEIIVKPGEGITQTIKDYYPGKSAGQYAEVYNKLSARFGAGHIIEGIRKYRMSDGSLGLSHAGKAHWGADVQSFIRSYFKHSR